MKSQYLNSNVCSTYKKLLSAMPDAPYKYHLAKSVDVQAHKFFGAKALENMSAQEIVNSVNEYHAQVPDKSVSPSKADTGGIEDNIPPTSKNEDQKSYTIRLVNLGLSLAAARTEAARVFGQSSEPVNAKLRKKLMNRINSRYPSLSPEQRAAVVDEAIREATVRENLKKSQKGISQFQSGTRTIYSASVNKEMNTYDYINAAKSGRINPLERTGNTASDNGVKDYLTVALHQQGKKFEENSNTRSASTQIVDVGKMASYDAKKLAEYNRQQNKGKIFSASKKIVDNRPDWVKIQDSYRSNSS